jgi:hypothetical protein
MLRGDQPFGTDEFDMHYPLTQSVFIWSRIRPVRKAALWPGGLLLAQAWAMKEE